MRTSARVRTPVTAVIDDVRGDALRDHRTFYAALVAARGGAGDPPIERAFAAVPRERFLGPGPWQAHTGDGYIETPSANPALLYQDVLFALDAGRGINNGQPSLHARCLAAAAVRPGERVLHIGCGSGYYTALLAELTGPDGAVVALDIDAGLAADAAANLTAWPNVTVQCRSGLVPPLPASDVVYVSAGCSYPPRPWVDALTAGGRLLFPLTPGWGGGAMLLVSRDAGDSRNALTARFICPCAFIPCIGAGSSQADAALQTAFQRGGARRVSRLQFGDAPVDDAWCAGDGWALR